MSISRDQSSLLASCHSQKEIEYLQAVIRTSIDKTPLKQISGIYEDENPENQRKEESNAKYQSVLQEINRAPLKKQKGEQLLEQWMGLKYQASILSFKEKSRNTQVSLRKQSSFFSCLACGDVCISQLYLQDQGSNKEQLIYFINFDTLKAGFSFRKQHQLYYFTIATAKHELTFSAEQQQAEYLRKKLEGIHQASLGNQLNLVQLESRHDYFKERLATQQYFNNSCATGDILLFQDDHFAAKVQRFITGSNFNHVGMVVKDPYFGVLILESNSKSGVCLTRWRSLIFNKWFKFIPKISWRRLSKVARNSSFQSTITRFLRDNLQKSFNISSRVLTANESVIIAAPDDENDEKPPGFFCSELIATLYKNLGLLTRDRENSNYQPACKFYPKDFSQLSGRKLDQGQLSPEYEIYFHPKLLLQSYPYLQAQQGPNPS